MRTEPHQGLLRKDIYIISNSYKKSSTCGLLQSVHICHLSAIISIYIPIAESVFSDEYRGKKVVITDQKQKPA